MNKYTSVVGIIISLYVLRFLIQAFIVFILMVQDVRTSVFSKTSEIVFPEQTSSLWCYLY